MNRMTYETIRIMCASGMGKHYFSKIFTKFSYTLEFYCICKAMFKNWTIFIFNDRKM